MIRRLRRKFVGVCMAAVLVVMVVLVALISLLYYLHSSAQVRDTLSFLAQNGGEFPVVQTAAEEGAQQPRRSPRRGQDAGFGLAPLDSPEAPFMTRHFSVRFDASGEVVSANTSSIAAISEEEAVEFAQAVLETGKSSGGYDVYRYLVSDYGEDTLVTFLDASVVLRMQRQILVLASTVAVVISAAVFLMAVLFSGKAVRPTVQSIERQRGFITDAGHELKTPLTIISANCEILELSVGENEWLDSIEKQTARMRRLVNDLVALSRLDEERPQTERLRFSLSDAVYDTAMAFAPAAERAGKALRVDTDPDVFLCGDEAAIRQLTSILMDNAVKYADAGGEICVRLLGGKHPVLCVENDFQNVDALELSRLFDRFYRADPARTGDGSHGLGLSIARSIAEAHRASIRAEKADAARLRLRVRF